MKLSKSKPGFAGARRRTLRFILLLAGILLAAVGAWQFATVFGHPDPLAPHTSGPEAVVDMGVLVFREGLECMLVLAAITAGLKGDRASNRNPIAIGAGCGFVVTLATWFVAVRILDDLSLSIPALALQAATGLLAIIVLLVVMNWFFHKVYWTGWISLHTTRKQQLLDKGKNHQAAQWGIFWGMALLGFTSVYREGFEVVLFLQSYRLRLGGTAVLYGVSVGLLLTAVTAALTFVAHRRLPFRRMLISTGILLGVVLLVMVGEEAQEMQLAHWISTTTIPGLVNLIPAWAGTWLSIFPTVETLLAQAISAVLVLGSYSIANRAATASARKQQLRASPGETSPVAVPELGRSKASLR
jgi:high-affinity iron transporter